jgi:hypothetical protein
MNRYKKNYLKEFRKKIAIFEAKYDKSYEEFSQSVPDTVKGHDDWIEWSYLIKREEALKNIQEAIQLYLEVANEKGRELIKGVGLTVEEYAV